MFFGEVLIGKSIYI